MITEEKYEHFETRIMDLIKLSLGNSTRYYDMAIDGVTIVEKTNNLELFDDYEKFLPDGRKEIVINQYTKNQTSPFITKRYIINLVVQPEKKPETQALNGMGLGELEAKINEKVSEKVSIERERWDCEQVKKDLSATKTKLTEAEEYMGKLQLIIEDTKKKLEEAKGFGEITSILKDLAMPALTGKTSPANGNLAGAEKKPEEQASFKMKSEGNNALSEDQKKYLHFGKMMEEKFSEGELAVVLAIIEKLAQDKPSIKPVAEFLRLNKNQQNQK